jgi:uncharacterized membrane protein YesL
MPDVEIGGRYGRLFRLLDWPIRLAVINLLWAAGVLAGLVIGGLAPATLAASTLLRRYFEGHPVQLWRDFWRCWRTELVRSQLPLGLPILTVWVIMFYAAMARHSPVGLALALVGTSYVVTLLYLPGVLTSRELPARKAWLFTLHVAWGRPLVTAGFGVACLLAFVACVLWIPAAVPFVFPVVPLAVALRLTPEVIPGRAPG